MREICSSFKTLCFSVTVSLPSASLLIKSLLDLVLMSHRFQLSILSHVDEIV